MASKSILLIAAAVGVGAISACTGQTDQSLNNTADKQVHAATAPAAQQASRVYIDPATGRRGVPPQGVVLAPAATAPLARAIVAPQVIDLGPGKGQKVDGRGLFQAITAHVDQDGKVTTNCKPSDAQLHHVTGDVK